MQIKNQFSLIYLSLLFSFLSFLLLILVFFNNQQKIVYVDSQILFDNFKMTQEMKKEGELIYNSKKKIVDSLENVLNKSSINNEENTRLFIKMKEELNSFGYTYSVNESSKIWERIQIYIKDFAQQSNYDLIISSDKSKNILHGDKNLDITDELLGFINKKYEGN